MAIQLTVVGRISLEVEKAGNAYFAANPAVDCEVLEKNDDEVTITIPEMGVQFSVSPWYNCNSEAKSIFQVNHCRDNLSSAAFDVIIIWQTPAQAATEANHEKQQIPEQPQCMMRDFKTSNLADGAAVKYCGHGDK